MKILTQTPDTLIIRIRNLTRIIGIVFLVAGIVCGTLTLFAPELPILYTIVQYSSRLSSLLQAHD